MSNEMSNDMLHIALVAEGITDYRVIEAAIKAMLTDRPYNLTLLQPEESVAFTGGGNAGIHGGGWRGVYKWCGQSVKRAQGPIRNDILFLTYDLLILQLDADVADEDPANLPEHRHPIPELAGILPCAKPCPPPSATTDQLRSVLLSWVGEPNLPPKVVLCTPSKSMEAWVLAMLFPQDREMNRAGWECRPEPENRLGAQTNARRIRKTERDYHIRQQEMSDRWENIASNGAPLLSEAVRFRTDFLAAI